MEDIQDKMNLNEWDYHYFTSDSGSVKYGDSMAISRDDYHFPAQWANEKSEKNAVEDILTQGTLGQSEQFVLMNEGYTTKKHTVTQTSWRRDLVANNFKMGISRSSQNDASIYYELFSGYASGARYWVASRVTEAYGSSNGYAGFGLVTVTGNSVKYNELIRSYSTGSDELNHILVVVHIPKSCLDLSVNYDDTGAWNLKS